MTVREVYNFIDKFAPFQNQMSSDNAGFLIGNGDAEITKVLTCLDMTSKIAHEAVESGVNLIVSHHPLMYPEAVSSIMADSPVHILIRNNINLIAAHTNIDVMFGGLPDLMLKLLNFPESETVVYPFNSNGTGFGRIIELASPLSAKKLAEKCKAVFNCTVVKYSDGGKPISKVGLTSGSGASLVEKARQMGCDAFICGDLKHSSFVYGSNYGITLIDSGHFHTEDIFCNYMIEKLKSEFPAIDVKKATNCVDVCEYV